MSRFLFLGTALFFGVMAAFVIRPHAPDRSVWPQPWSATTPAVQMSSAAAPEPPQAAAAVPAPTKEGGTPFGLYAVAGAVLAVAGAGAGIALGRRREPDTLAEVDLQDAWYCVMTAHTADGEQPLRRGVLRWPALNAAAVEAEAVRRHEAAYGRPDDGTVYVCRAVPAARWTIHAGPRKLAEGAVGLDGATPEGMAVQLLDEYATERGLGRDEIRRLRCAVWGPDGYGEADGRDW